MRYCRLYVQFLIASLLRVALHDEYTVLTWPRGFRFRFRSFLFSSISCLACFRVLFLCSRSLSRFSVFLSLDWVVFHFVSIVSQFVPLGGLFSIHFPLLSSRPRTGWATTFFLTWTFHCEVPEREIALTRHARQAKKRASAILCHCLFPSASNWINPPPSAFPTVLAFFVFSVFFSLINLVSSCLRDHEVVFFKDACTRHGVPVCGLYNIS